MRQIDEPQRLLFNLADLFQSRKFLSRKSHLSFMNDSTLLKLDCSNILHTNNKILKEFDDVFEKISKYPKYI